MVAADRVQRALDQIVDTRAVVSINIGRIDIVAPVAWPFE
jgi:hypothetical protein